MYANIQAHHEHTFYSGFIKYEAVKQTKDDNGNVIRFEFVLLSEEEFNDLLPSFPIESRHTCNLFHSCKRIYSPAPKMN